MIALLAVCIVALLAGAPIASAEPSRETALPRPEAVRAYWTPERMRAATPAELRLAADGRPQRPPPPARAAVDVGDTTAFPQRVNGKVFFTIEGGSSPGDFVCSGTVVSSNSHTLAWTAGHCVHDAEFGGGFATNWAFVPAYRDGARPYGTWPAVQLLATRGWRQHANTRVDLGVAQLARDSQGRGIEDLTGARALAFETDREQAYTAFGYPAVSSLLRPEFDGERLYSCTSPPSGGDDPPGSGPETLAIECDMSGGSSGGSWVLDDGRVASVTSYGYASDPFHLYGPYQGSAARELFEEASGRPLLCAGAAVTNLGGGERDVFTGGDGEDTFRLAGGPDRAEGAPGADRACGGAGGDRLTGSDGDDVLHGGAGRDVLRGGPGTDVCDGGAGRDLVRSCEGRRRIP